MKRTIWTPTLAWLGAVTAALMLALAAPKESNLMGQLPTLAAQGPDHQRIVLPAGLTADRTLVLVAYTRSQRAETDSWIQGLGLYQDSPIAWIRMPVLNDPGNQVARNAIASRIAQRHAAGSDRARLVPVFTNQEAFVRAAGLSSTEHASVLVVNRDGRVLARAEGPFDESRAQALRETLLASRD